MFCGLYDTFGFFSVFDVRLDVSPIWSLQVQLQVDSPPLHQWLLRVPQLV